MIVGATAAIGTALFQANGDISMRGSSDVDRSLIFASDASQLWDESEDFWVFNKAIKAEGGLREPNTIHSDSDTSNNVYDALSAFVPAIGDEMLITGGARYGTGGDIILSSWIERISATEIRIEGINIVTENVDNVLVTDGDPIVMHTSLAW